MANFCALHYTWKEYTCRAFHAAWVGSLFAKICDAPHAYWTDLASCIPEWTSWIAPEQLARACAQYVEGANGIEQEEQRRSLWEMPYNAGANWRTVAPEVLAVAFPPGVELAIVLPGIEGTVERNGAA